MVLVGERDGQRTCETFARKGETMTTTAIVASAYDYTDQARQNTAIWRTSLTSGETILTWTTPGMVVAD